MEHLTMTKSPTDPGCKYVDDRGRIQHVSTHPDYPFGKEGPAKSGDVDDVGYDPHHDVLADEQ
jgi:hypothetical protein